MVVKRPNILHCVMISLIKILFFLGEFDLLNKNIGNYCHVIEGISDTTEEHEASSQIWMLHRPSHLGNCPEWKQRGAELSVLHGLPRWLSDKNLLASAGDTRDVSSIPGARRSSGVGRSPGGEHDNSLQYSCLENSMGRGTWWASPEVTKSRTESTEHMGISTSKGSVHLMAVNYVSSSGEDTSFGPYLLMTTLKQQWFGDLLKATQ